MFKKNNKIELDKKAAKQLVKESNKSLIVLNEKSGLVNGDPESIYISLMGAISGCLDKGVISVESLLNLIDMKLDKKAKNEIIKNTKTKGKIKKEKKDGTKENSKR